MLMFRDGGWGCVVWCELLPSNPSHDDPLQGFTGV